eukprot:6192324-Pleurochrysis_carterae.AAC.1
MHTAGRVQLGACWSRIMKRKRIDGGGQYLAEHCNVARDLHNFRVVRPLPMHSLRRRHQHG